LSSYIVEIAFVHTQDEIDWREVQAARSRAEAEAIARTLFRREAWGQYRDPVILSVTAEPVADRYGLRLGEVSA
jgi:hypothetical protein